MFYELKSMIFNTSVNWWLMIFIAGSMFFDLLYDLHGFAPLRLLIFGSREVYTKVTLRGFSHIHSL